MSVIRFDYGEARGSGAIAELRSVEDIGKYALVTPSISSTEHGWVEDANANSLDKMPVIGMLMDHGYPGRFVDVLLQGFIWNGDWNWSNQAVLYADSVDGGIIEGDPISATSQQVATSFTPKWIYFDPKCYTINL